MDNVTAPPLPHACKNLFSWHFGPCVIRYVAVSRKQITENLSNDQSDPRPSATAFLSVPMCQATNQQQQRQREKVEQLWMETAFHPCLVWIRVIALLSSIEDV